MIETLWFRDLIPLSAFLSPAVLPQGWIVVAAASFEQSVLMIDEEVGV